MFFVVFWWFVFVSHCFVCLWKQWNNFASSSHQHMRSISYAAFTRPRVYQDLLVACCTLKSWYLDVLLLNKCWRGQCRKSSKITWHLHWIWTDDAYGMDRVLALTKWNSHTGTVSLGHHRSSRFVCFSSRIGRKKEVKNEMEQGSDCGEVTSGCWDGAKLPRHHVIMKYYEGICWGKRPGKSWE